jgi:hypothetical protein
LLRDSTGRAVVEDGKLDQPATGSGDDSHGSEADVLGLSDLTDPVDSTQFGRVLLIVLHYELVVQVAW